MRDHVRPIALAVIRREKDDAILVFEGYDAVKDQKFYRPLGGTIEFSERSEKTVRRELEEEVGLGLCDVCYLATVENIFVHQGETGHEIVMLYNARLDETAAFAYDLDEIQGAEDTGQSFTALWVPLNTFCPNGPPLYPTGLLELLTDKT